MKNVGKIVTAVLFLAGITLTVFPSAQAQEDVFTLEEIKVTAEKREVNVQDTAISITAISGADIRDRAESSVSTLLQSVPGLQVQGFQEGNQVFIRGIGSNVDADMADPSTALMVDGVYSSRAESTLGSLYDISRVEVLRGPQGTLYGRNAVGGTVNMVSNAPTDKFEASGTFRIGDYNLKHFDGALNVPMTDKLAGRVAVLREVRDGYLSDGGVFVDKFSYRAKLSYKPTEKLDFLATYERTEDNGNQQGTVPVPGSAGNLPAGGWSEDFDYEGGWVVPEGSDAWTNDEYHAPGLYDMTFNSYSLQIQYDLGWAGLTILPSYSENDRIVLGDNMMGGTATANQATDANTMDGSQWSGEMRLASAADAPFTWIVGYYWYKQESEMSSQAGPATEAGQWAFTTYESPNESTAIFGQVTYPLTETFRLTGGLRYSMEDKSMDYRFTNDAVPVDDPYYQYRDENGAYDSGRLNYSNDIKNVTYKAGVEYDVLDNSMLYAQISTGFKAGGLNSAAPPTEYDEEELVSYEIGSKSRFFGNRMQLNMGFYYYQYDNMQIKVFTDSIIADTGTLTFAQEIQNAGEGTNWGGELETDYLLTQNDRLKATLTYMKAEYGELTLPADTMGGYPDETPLEGTTVANTPEWVTTLGYTHTWKVDTGAEISASLNTRISTGYWTTIQKYLDGAWQGSFHRSDANINYQSPDGTWSTSVWIKNIENEAQTTWVMPYYRRVVTEPRTFGVNFSFRY